VRAFVNQLFGRLRNREDSEHEQAIWRVAIPSVVLCYMLGIWTVSPEPYASSHLFWAGCVVAFEGLLGAALVAAILMRPAPSNTRRYIGMVADYTALAAVMILYDRVLAPLYVVYLWVTIGNGLRYGPKFLAVAIAMAGVSFSLVITRSGFWQDNAPLAWGLWIGLVAIPSYLSSLLRALTRASDEARRANAAKSRFLANMSHEFRTPLNSIQALSRLLKEEADGPLNPEQSRQVDFISKAAVDLTALVDDLLDLAKIEAGKTEVRPVEFNITNLFSALRGMLRPLLVGEGVRLVFDEPEGPLELYTDEGKVSQILRNFISNAIKFTERGEVRVSATPSRDGRSVAFAVTDTGIGISPDYQETIFEEFTQIPSSLQAKVKGTGLGLPLCRRLARLLRGEVNVTSEVGVGSVFAATLPMHYEEDSVPAAATVELPIEAGLMPVMIIDDEVELRHILTRYLRDSRYQPFAARNLREARELMQRVRPQAIVLDIMLKGEDSWRWLSDLKSSDATANIPVIVVTTVEDERKARALGADAYCVKPITAQQLLSELDSLTARRVLVIDDDPAARYLLHKLLEDSKVCVIEARDGRSGLAAARRSKPSLIFLDLNLPDLGGEDVLEELRRDTTLQEVPVAIVTSALISRDQRERLSRRAQSVVQKSELNGAWARSILASNGLGPFRRR
jgi:signal transduction histidine kinase/DNA-binding response OmpR family regulator